MKYYYNAKTSSIQLRFLEMKQCYNVKTEDPLQTKSSNEFQHENLINARKTHTNYLFPNYNSKTSSIHNYTCPNQNNTDVT